MLMGLFTLECEQVFFMYPLSSFWFNWQCSKIKNLRKKGLIFYQKKRGTLTMKKYVDGEHVHVATMYFRQFSQKCKLSS